MSVGKCKLTGFPIKALVTAVIVLGALLSALTSAGVAHVPLAAAAGPTTWTVLVGGQAGIVQLRQGPAGAWQFMRFYPETITVNVGDTIVWKIDSAEMHTVTFPKAGEQAPWLVIPAGGDSQRMLLNPLVIFPQGGPTYDGTALTGSGQLGGDPQSPTEYQLTLTKEGTSEYVCAFHPMMKGNVIVQAAGAAYPKTQAQIDAEAAAQLAADTEAATKAEPEAGKASTRSGPNGVTIHEVNTGYGDGILAWMRFGPGDLTISVGDSVEWTQKDVDTPHTVTFTSGGIEPELVLVEEQQNGPPKLVLNPEVMAPREERAGPAPAGGSTYSGQGYFNSGWIWGTKDPAPGPRTYSLTFDTPGAYEYICVLHDAMGMSGHITVLAEGAPTPTVAAEALKAEDKDGLPVPDNYTSYVGENGAYRQSVTAVSPSDLKTVLEFYRRELSARQWIELPGTGGTTDSEATVSYEKADKQALVLKLTHNAEGGTDINLTVKLEGAASEAGILPPSGQARVYLGNMTDAQVVFTINQKDIKVTVQDPAQNSMKGVPFVDVSPGRQDFTLTMAGQSPIKDSMQLGPDETWALIAGPGGALPLQMY